MEYPLLWTTIYISNKPHYGNVSLFFSRSLPLKVEVTLDITRSTTIFFHITPAYRHILQLVKENVNRLGSLSIRTLRLEDFHKFSEALQCDAAPVLQRLEVMVHLGIQIRTDINSERPIIRNAPRLNFLRIDMILSDCLPSIGNLTQLDITNYSPSLKEFKELFGGCPNLTDLVLHRFQRHLHDSGDNDSLAIEAPRLHSLAINFERHYLFSNGCNCPICYFSTPNLKYLEVSKLSDSSFVTDCLPLLLNLPWSANLELTSATCNALPLIFSMPNFTNVTLDLNSMSISTWNNLFRRITVVSSPVLFYVPPSSCDAHPVQIVSIHKNISVSTSPFRKGVIVSETWY
ncbi:hypothetical protein BDQ17DRAFT_676499 [Cyathus striatus]|nr:hypothetical protein BDQ17DRAFT_676499 [Cyathus striatus]